ncbi:MAG TPA: hypothetical protein VG604_02400 [Candidatus Saccharimonadales bacterium]|nr:hypothetical protein [Candidatus Saccharimonadales bacterium]
MGRLIKRSHWVVLVRRTWPRLRPWLAPLAITLVILFGVNSAVKADPAPPSSELQAYLQSNELNLFDDSSSGLPQVYYFFNHKPVQLTSGDYGALHPVSSGKYVAYLGIIDGLSQVFLQDVLSDSILQLSVTAPNEGISIHGNHVAWQTWDGHDWQINYYDGASVHQITSGTDNSINVQTNGSQVVYATELGPNTWEARSYDTTTGQTVPIRQGDVASTAYPHFGSDGTISTAFDPSY